MFNKNQKELHFFITKLHFLLFLLKILTNVSLLYSQLSLSTSPWDHSENLKKCAFREGVHLKKEISYDLYIFETGKSMYLERNI